VKHTCASCFQPVPDLAGITADRERREVSFQHKTVTLTRKEYDIFELLLHRRGRPVNVSEFHHQIYQLDPNGGPDLFAVRVYVCRMRKKIESIGLEIESHWHGSHSLREPKRKPVAAPAATLPKVLTRIKAPPAARAKCGRRAVA
jgi:two-component system cell cycle response regulator CtrA